MFKIAHPSQQKQNDQYRVSLCLFNVFKTEPHLYTHTHTHTHTHKHAYITHTHTHTYTNMHTSVHTLTHTHTNVHTTIPNYTHTTVQAQHFVFAQIRDDIHASCHNGLIGSNSSHEYIELFLNWDLPSGLQDFDFDFCFGKDFRQQDRGFWLTSARIQDVLALLFSKDWHGKNLPIIHIFNCFKAI